MPPGSLRDTAVRGLELLGGMRGLAGKIAEGVELLPADLRARELPASPDPLSERRVRRLLEEEWEEDVDEILDELEPEPRVLASTGQVHRGVRARDGAAVAIKVQRPGIAEAVRADLGLVATIARLGAALSPGLDVAGLAARVRSEVLDELDHELEAQRQRAFARAYRGHPFLHVPDVDTRLSTRRVLVGEWVDGLGARGIAALAQGERDRVAEALQRFYLGSPFRAGLVHADPHPHNWLLREDGRVAVLDYGAAGPVDRARVALSGEVFAAGARSDAAGAHAALTRLGYLPDPEAVDPDRLLAATLSMADWWVDRERVVRIDPELLLEAAETAEHELTPLLDAIVLPPEDLLVRRSEGGLAIALAVLEPELPWGAIGAEWWADGPPAGRLGEADREFWAAR